MKDYAYSGLDVTMLADLLVDYALLANAINWEDDIAPCEQNPIRWAEIHNPRLPHPCDFSCGVVWILIQRDEEGFNHVLEVKWS